jgi:hypothetical protein
MTTRSATSAAVLALLALFGLGALALPPALSAQEPPDTPEEPFFDREVRFGFRLGAFDMLNSADSYDAVYGDPLPLVGGQVEWRFRPRFLFGLSASYGEVDGERAFPSDPPIPLGIDTTLTYLPVHVTTSWRLDRPEERAGEWALWLGAGPTFLKWEDDSGLGETVDGTELGGHVALSLRRLGEGWIFGGELLWSTVPNAAGEGAFTKLYDEDDMGGASLTFLALRRF